MSMGHFFKYYVDYQSLLILESPTAQGRSWRWEILSILSQIIGSKIGLWWLVFWTLIQGKFRLE